MLCLSLTIRGSDPTSYFGASMVEALTRRGVVLRAVQTGGTANH